MKQIVDNQTILKSLDWVYEKATSDKSIVGLKSSLDLAKDYMCDDKSPQEQANSLVNYQVAKAATSGFITGLPGLLAIPVTLPANITSVLFVQVQMIAAIAHIGGHNIKDDKVKTLVFLCLTGSATTGILKDAGIKVGERLAANMIKNLSGQVVKEINKKVGMKLLTKAGEKGVINLGKLIPVVGGVISGTIDGVSTNIVGNKSIDLFISKGA